MTDLISLYQNTFGTQCDAFPITAAGSNRRYYRLLGPEAHAVVGVVGTSRVENDSFCYLSDHFAALGLPVPKVLARSADGMRYLQEDLGTHSLFDDLALARACNGSYGDRDRALLRKTIALLPAFQVRGAEGLDKSRLLPPTDFDARTVLFDLNYFKYCFLRTTNVPFDEVRLQDDLEAFARFLCEPQPACAGGEGFLYRDFQARNVMLSETDEPYFIDFQSGRRGPVQYDVASFLWQASARYPSELREELIGVYLRSLRTFRPEVDDEAFVARLRAFVLFRLLQVLGAYGLRGRFERKPHFLKSIPPALALLSEQLATGVAAPYPELESVLRALTEEPQLTQKPKNPQTHEPQNLKTYEPKNLKTSPALIVRVYSFSYKKGIPTDPSGNGGGYVFDCRAPHNPGRYDAYKHFTGRDEVVIRFLEDDGEIFLLRDCARRLADFHVQRYIERDFTSLMFCFGCTGGQHRSVYMAEYLAHYVHDTFGVEVHLCHREQGISEVLAPRT